MNIKINSFFVIYIRYAIEHVNTGIARHFAKELDTNLNESSVGGLKSAFEQVATDITRLPKSPRRCLLKLSDMDRKVCEFKESPVLQAVLSILEFT